MKSIERPYVLHVAEKIYLEISKIKKNNLDFSNIDSIENFIGTKLYNEISSGEFHNRWLEKLKKDNFMDHKTNKKIPEETIKLLHVQRDMVIKELFHFPKLYYTKSHFPLEISQNAFNHLWRMCESYELWCKETKQNKLLLLNIID